MNLEGLFLQPDRWPACSGNNLIESDGWSDDSFPGCDYRLPSNHGYQLAVNVSITGRKSHPLDFNRYKTRVKVEYVGDGEPSQFDGGWIFSDNPLIN